MKNNFLKLVSNQIFIFLFAFFLMAIKLFPLKDFFHSSGDAIETWKVTTTFLTSHPEHSYVMYKGFLAIIPSVIFYQLSLLFHTNQFLFSKLFNCLLFAYISTIGLPFFFSSVFKHKIPVSRIYALIFVLFLGIGEYFTYINTDVLNVVFLILVVNSSIKIAINKKIPLLYLYYTGLVFSACSSLSGQYVPAVILSSLYLFTSKFSILSKIRSIKPSYFFIILSFALGFFTVSYANNYFNQTRVEPVRKSGGWLPTGSDWLKWGLLNKMTYQKMSNFGIIPDNRGIAILKAEKFNMIKVNSGDTNFNYIRYFKLICKHPLDFLSLWSKRLFLGISIDNDRLSFIYLFFSYTFLFISFLTIKTGIQKIKDITQIPKTFLLLAFIVTSLIPCLLSTEMRYFVSLQILIIGTAIISDTFWKILNNFKFPPLIRKDTRINYTLISYFIFLVFCFTLFASIYESYGPYKSILFKF